MPTPSAPSSAWTRRPKVATFSPTDPRITAAIQQAADTWGAKYGVVVPTEVVRGIMVRESGSGDPTMVDTLATRTETSGPAAGHSSYGLMQVLDSTAAGLGLTGDPTALYIPEIGISYGVKYFAQQLARYGGDVARAVAAYNSGSVFRTSDGSFVNQDYVDFVMDQAAQFGQALTQVATTAAAGAGSPLGLAVIFLIVVLYLARKRGSK
jgi:hypothetical protein